MLTAPLGSSILVPPDMGVIEMAPEPDSTGSVEESYVLPHPSSGSPLRRSSQPVSGSPRDTILERRSSEGSGILEYPISYTGTADWSEESSSLSHIFMPTSSSSESCYNNCVRVQGTRVKCVACRIVVHTFCISKLNSTVFCKQSFRENVRKYREQTSVSHHWINKKNLKGKCKSCGKNFQNLLGFGMSGNSSSFVGYSCSWCKYSYHNKESCTISMSTDKDCDLGVHAPLIVPPSWIVKLPRKGSFKSSLKNSPSKKRLGLNKMNYIDEAKSNNNNNNKATRVSSYIPFCIKPIPSPNISPLLVFLNPKSGGNQGVKLMQKFQWLLNPRQVFDLTQGGPQPAIELFKKVSNVKLLACGGDGTVGWLLSVLDKVTVDSGSSVGVLPLGTGNDLSRSLGWGGGYIDEPISKILHGLEKASEVQMDRWILDVVRNPEFPSTDKGEDSLPLNVVNNYFSLGVDAQIALKFHEAREANPSKFNSRIRNKMYYGQAGGKDLLLRKWKDLSDEITVECDGKDITQKLKEHRVHSVLFANIPSFGSGTHPWNRAYGEQRMDDGLIEVMGLTTYQLPLLQAGGHATCLTQCKVAKIVTKKTIPMQVDGEASRLNPATITLSYLNQVSMLSKKKGDSCKKVHLASSSPIKISVYKISMSSYEAFHYESLKLKESSQFFGDIETSVKSDLEQVRLLINKSIEKHSKCSQSLSLQWCFIDSVTAIRFFRIDKAQENLHYVIDICDEENLYILGEEEEEEEEVVEDVVVVGDDDDDDTPRESPDVVVEDVPENHLISSFLSHSPEPHQPLQPHQPLPPFVEKTSEGVLKAARLGDLRMLSDLYHQDYSLLSIDETGKTALHYGARFGHKEIIRFLIAKAPSSILDMIDNEKGQTALHKAANYKRRTICCMLVAAGASLILCDLSGATPRTLALLAEDHDLSSYLESQEHFQNEKDVDDFETPV